MRQHDSPLKSGSPLGTVRGWQYVARAAGKDAVPFAGDCTEPVTRMVVGHDDAALHKLRRWSIDPSLDAVDRRIIRGEWGPARQATSYIEVRCRKCEKCLYHRRRLWSAKTALEVRLSARSWFVTLTFAPAQRFLAKAAAESRVRTRRREAWTMLTPNERFRAIERETSLHVTKWLKRLRKNTGVKVRYILVSEAHADGFPHYHAIIHEIEASSITKRAIQSTWLAGFSNAKVIDQDGKQIRYVCKYLSKSASTRVRASQRYGQPSMAALNQRVKEVISGLPARMFGGVNDPTNREK